MKKVALITGATSDLGKEVVKKLSAKGYIVFATSREKFTPENKNVVAFLLDVRNREKCEDVVKKIIKKRKRIDCLINIAGYTISGPTLSFEEDDLKELLDVNLFGPFRLIKIVYPFMKRAGGGRIINITSLNGLVSLPNFGLYSSSKHALEALGNALYYELYKEKIFVTNLAPGAIKKEDGKLLIPHKPAREKFFILKLLMPMLKAEEVAEVIVELLENPSPPPTLVMGADAKIVLALKGILPGFIWSRLMRYVWER